MRTAPDGDVVEPGDERGERGLARARRTDERDQLPRRDRQRDVVQHFDRVAAVVVHGGELERRHRCLVGAGVTEGDVVELDRAR